MRRLLGASKYLIGGAVLGCFAVFVIVLVYGLGLVVTLSWDLFRAGISIEGKETLKVMSFELLDLFLIATILYIVALGLYSLFIDGKLPLPGALKVSSLQDLKRMLAEGVLVVLLVLFLGRAAEWERGIDILYFGIAVGLVIAAVALLLRFGRGDD
jgi:uncharacterized membrane protein YqhA